MVIFNYLVVYGISSPHTEILHLYIFPRSPSFCSIISMLYLHYSIFIEKNLNKLLIQNLFSVLLTRKNIYLLIFHHNFSIPGRKDIFTLNCNGMFFPYCLGLYVCYHDYILQHTVLILQSLIRIKEQLYNYSILVQSIVLQIAL